MELGLANEENVFSYSSCQQAEVPAGATQADLSFYYLPMMAATGEDEIYFYILQADSDVALQCDRWTDLTTNWQRGTASLPSYAGMRIKVHFRVRNDDTGGISSVYLDDVELCVR